MKRVYAKMFGWLLFDSIFCIVLIVKSYVIWYVKFMNNNSKILEHHFHFHNFLPVDFKGKLQTYHQSYVCCCRRIVKVGKEPTMPYRWENLPTKIVRDGKRNKKPATTRTWNRFNPDIFQISKTPSTWIIFVTKLQPRIKHVKCLVGYM